MASTHPSGSWSSFFSSFAGASTLGGSAERDVESVFFTEDEVVITIGEATDLATRGDECGDMVVVVAVVVKGVMRVLGRTGGKR